MSSPAARFSPERSPRACNRNKAGDAQAILGRFREVALYLIKDCCGGRADPCAPLIADLAPCRPPKEAAHG